MRIVKIVSRSKKRKGQGHGSGKVKTGGRGTKGQNARNPLSIRHSHYEGGQRPLTKRLPYLRGKGNAKVSRKPYLLSLTALSKFPIGTEVDKEFLVKENFVTRKMPVKILGNGQLTVALTVKVLATKSAVAAIIKAGGKYEYISKEVTTEPIEQESLKTAEEKPVKVVKKTVVEKPAKQVKKPIKVVKKTVKVAKK